MIRRVLTVAAALLAAFHVWIFASQLWSGELADLALISRWIIAGGLTAALLNLHRRGLPLVRGRQAIAVWLLAALMHGPALARNLDLVAPSMPEVVSTLAQTVTGVVAIGTLLLLLLSSLRVRLQAPVRGGVAAFASMPGPASLSGSVCPFAPRPPPRLA